MCRAAQTHQAGKHLRVLYLSIEIFNLFYNLKNSKTRHFCQTRTCLQASTCLRPLIKMNVNGETSIIGLEP